MLKKIALLYAPDSAAGVATAPPSATPPANPPKVPSTPTGGAGAGKATPAPAATPPPSADNKPDADADIFSDLDAAMRAPAAPKQPDAPAAAPVPPAAPKKDAPAPAAEPAKPAEPAAATPPDKTPKGLRDYANRMENENKTYKAQIAEMERKIASAEEKGRDTTKLTERLSTLERQLEERQAEIRMLRQEASPEFKAKYEQPFNDAAEYAKQIVEGLEVITNPGDPDNDVQPTVRAATWDDFSALYHLPVSQATKAAKQLFGDSAQTVLNHLQELKRLDYVKTKALNEERTQAKEKMEKEVAQQSQQKEWAAKAWREVNMDLSEKNPEYFQPDPKDQERAALFTKSIQLVDSRHNVNALTPVQRVTLDAQVRLRAAAYPVVQYDLQKAKARIAELEGIVAQYDGSKPGAVQRPDGGAVGQPSEEGFVEALNKLQ